VKKQFKLGPLCGNRFAGNCKCHQYKDVVFTYDIGEKLEDSKASKYIPPIHKGCDCTLVDIVENVHDMEEINEERKVCKEIGLFNVGDFVAIVSADDDKLYQVVLGEGQKEELKKMIMDMHGGIIRCLDSPLYGIKLGE
jgi:NAD+--asparagine ADP-ribosyltransferase